MNSIINILKDLTIHKNSKSLNLTQLPSQGYFYPKDFWVKIKKAELQDIMEYNHFFDYENPILIIELIKQVVKNNIYVSSKYSFSDIRAIDIVYVFMEIVKLTKDKKIFLNGDTKIEISATTFNYFIPSNKYKYNIEEKCFEYRGFKFRFPSIGVEESIFRFSSINANYNILKWDEHNYDFSYFLPLEQNHLKYNEIENLLTVFEDDLNEDSKQVVDEILNYFKPMLKYSLKINNEVILLDQRVSLRTIWDN